MGGLDALAEALGVRSGRGAGRSETPRQGVKRREEEAAQRRRQEMRRAASERDDYFLY